MKLAPITVFVYNRPWHIRKTIEALRKNRLAKESRLFIFSDGLKNEKDLNKVKEVRKYIKAIDGFKTITITERKKNFGLAESIISGVTKIINKYGKIIVLEDDLLPSPYFLKFMNEGLNFYEKEERVASIHGYIYPIKGTLPETFFLKHPGCWGWATWKNRWEFFEQDGKILLKELKDKKLTNAFDFNNTYFFTKLLKNQAEGKLDSWAVRWWASLFLKNKLTLYPKKSLISHIGNDNSGVHTGFSHYLDTKLTSKPIYIKKINIKENITAFNIFSKYYKSINPPFPFGLIRSLKRKIFTVLYITKILKFSTHDKNKDTSRNA